MEQEVLLHRNAVFSRIYYHTLTFYKVLVPMPIRWIIEIGILLMAVLTLLLWGYVHFTYITSSEDCLMNITERPFPRDVILQVEVYSNSSDLWNKREKALQDFYEEISDDIYPLFEKEKQLESSHTSTLWQNKFLDSLSQFCETNILVNLTGTKVLCVTLYEELAILGNGIVVGKNDTAAVCTYSVNKEFFKMLVDYHRDNVVLSSDKKTLYELFDYYNLQMLVLDYTLLEFSQEPGYISLTDSSRSKLNISVMKIYVDPSQSTCFGGPFGQFLTKYFLGYDMMIIASFKHLLPPNLGSGYVKSLMTGNQYYYKVQWMGKWRYGAGLLPALFFTLVASVLLRQIHYHIFKFLTHFHNLLNQGIPIPIQTGAQIPFLVVTYATIGLVIVMSEALSDDSVFSLLMIGTVWEVDQYFSIFCKQETSKTYLPWFFFLYHFLPYAYYIRFNGQFWFIPFLFHWFMLQHSMVFFLHHCELPALVNRVNHQLPAVPDQAVINPIQAPVDLSESTENESPVPVSAEIQPSQIQEHEDQLAEIESDSLSRRQRMDSDIPGRTVPLPIQETRIHSNSNIHTLSDKKS